MPWTRAWTWTSRWIQSTNQDIGVLRHPMRVDVVRRHSRHACAPTRAPVDTRGDSPPTPLAPPDIGSPHACSTLGDGLARDPLRRPRRRRVLARSPSPRDPRAPHEIQPTPASSSSRSESKRVEARLRRRHPCDAYHPFPLALLRRPPVRPTRTPTAQLSLSPRGPFVPHTAREPIAFPPRCL